MASYGDGGTVAVKLVLFGVKDTERKLKRFERRTKVTLEKTQRAASKFGQNFAKSIGKATASLIKFAAAGAAVGASLFVLNSLRTGIQNAVSLDRSLALLTRTLGEGGKSAALYARNLGKLYGTGITKTVKAFAQFSAAATAANVTLELQQKVFEQTTKAGIAFGLSQEQTGRAFQALQQIASKGVASMEELRQQLGEQVPIALAATAEGAGITAKALIDLISSGKLSSKDFFEFYAKGMEPFTKGAESADIATQAINKFTTAWEELNLAFTESMLPEIVALMKDLKPRMESFGKRRLAERLSGGWGENGFMASALGIESFGTKAVRNFQEILKKQGYGTNGSNAMITDAVKAVKGEVYMSMGLNKGMINIYSKEDEKAILDQLNKIVEEDIRAGKDPKSIAAGSKRNRDEKVLAAEAAAKFAETEEKIEKENQKWVSKETKSREDFLLRQVEKRVGAEAAGALAASQALKKSQIERTTAMEKYKQATTGDLTTPAGMAAVLEAEASYTRATAENMRLAAEASFTIQESFTNAKEQAKEAAVALSKAKTNLAGILVDPKQGIGKYLNSTARNRRADAGKQLLLNRARQIRSDVMPTIKNFDDRASFRENTKLNTFSVKQLQDFISNAGGELEAQRALTKANDDLTKANHELSEVMKIAANNQVPLNETNAVLNQTINELVNKDWIVNVEVPGGSASGDVVALQNSLQ